MTLQELQMKKVNKAGEKEMKKHIKVVKCARKSLKKDAGKLKKDIGKDMTYALGQDKKIMSDMKSADRVKCKMKKC